MPVLIWAGAHLRWPSLLMRARNHTSAEVCEPADIRPEVPLAGYASRRLSTQNVTASRAAASTTKMPVSMPWNAQNLLAGW